MDLILLSRLQRSVTGAMNYCFIEVQNYIKGSDSQGLIQQPAPGALSIETWESLDHPHSNARLKRWLKCLLNTGHSLIPITRVTDPGLVIQSCIQSYEETGESPRLTG